MDNKRLIELLLKEKNRSLSPVEQEELTGLKDKLSIKAVGKELEDFIHTPLSFSDEVSHLRVDQSAERLRKKLLANEGKRAAFRINRRKLFSIAASLLVCVSAVLLFLQQPLATAAKTNTVATKKGSKSNIQLPDGTEVWINSDTKLSYPASFSKTNREVFLTGEAYFDVAHDKNHPFIVHTPTIDIKVLGTAFNVRSYSQEPFTEAVLLRGKIEVMAKDDPDFKIVMNPADKIKIPKIKNESISKSQLEKIRPEQVTVENNEILEASWIKDKLFFEDMPLKWIAAELERQFNIKVIFKSGQTKEYRYTFFLEELNLEQALQRIKLLKHINYVIIDDKQVIIE